MDYSQNLIRRQLKPQKEKQGERERERDLKKVGGKGKE